MRRITAFSGLACLGGIAAAAAGQTYTVFELPPPPGTGPYTAARFVENDVAVGRASTSPTGGTEWRVRWDRTPGGWQPSVVCGNGVLDAVSTGGTIVGGFNGFIHENGACSAVPTPAGMQGGCFLFHITPAGDRIAGWCLTGPGLHNAAVWNGPGPGWIGTPLPRLSGTQSNAAGIDASGRIGGWAFDIGDVYRAVNWEPGTAGWQLTVLPESGNGAISWSVAAPGRSCGMVFTGSAHARAHAALWDSATASPVLLAPLPPHDNSLFWHINGRGEAVGWSYPGHAVGNAFGNSGSRAVIARQGELADLNTLISGASGPGQWVLREAWGVNERGEIAGAGVLGGIERGFVLIPCYPNCDGSTIPPVLNVQDFACFINEFAAAQALPHAQQVTHYANCDNSTTAPVLNVEDFTCFINKFAQGCP
jgi:hypothetical protein